MKKVYPPRLLNLIRSIKERSEKTTPEERFGKSIAFMAQPEEWIEICDLALAQLGENSADLEK